MRHYQQSIVLPRGVAQRHTAEGEEYRLGGCLRRAAERARGVGDAARLSGIQDLVGHRDHLIGYLGPCLREGNANDAPTGGEGLKRWVHHLADEIRTRQDSDARRAVGNDSFREARAGSGFLSLPVARGAELGRADCRDVSGRLRSQGAPLFHGANLDCSHLLKLMRNPQGCRLSKDYSRIRYGKVMAKGVVVTPRGLQGSQLAICVDGQAGAASMVRRDRQEASSSG